MNPTIVFPFAEYYGFYLCFSAFICLLLLVDLGIFHKDAHEVSIKEATIWSAVWVSLGLLFAVFLNHYASWSLVARGWEQAAADAKAQILMFEYLGGFVVEKALAVDNLFVFVAIFTYLAIPPLHQHKILFYGIIGALVFRAIFIALGSWLLQYEAVVMFFGVVLAITGVKLFFAPTESTPKNRLIKILERRLPVHNDVSSGKFFVRINGKRLATPMFVALVAVECSDIIFAVDSVPAIFALTNESMIVFTSNVFAILGLRSLYFVLAGMYHRFGYLKFGLGIILVFIGVKMVWLNEHWGGKFPISWSLGFICSVLLMSIATSMSRSSPSTQN